MKNILVIGAGRSASSLIKYLLDQSVENDFFVKIVDRDITLVKSKINGHERGEALSFDVFEDKEREKALQDADIVVSMLPAQMHYTVAKDCVRLSKPMVTASYVSNEIAALHEEADKKGVLLLNEIGLDPGIDHMSAMQLIDQILEKGGSISAFKSYCGGLIAPEYDNNPWRYKFTWNPRNVVLAGKGVAQFIQNGRYKYIPYNKLFSRTDHVQIPNFGDFEAYANRDSLSYRSLYKLDDIPTMYRGTLRRPGFSYSWNTFVQLGMTDDSYDMADIEDMTYRQYTNSFLSYGEDSVEVKMAKLLGVSADSDEMKKLVWLGLFEDTKIGLSKATPAQVLQKLLESKWSLSSVDKDLIVMQHQFEYTIDGEEREYHSSLAVVGDDQTFTGMAKTVGLPVGIATKLILQGKIKSTGVKIPVYKEIYEPVLKELASYGITFVEERIR